MTDDKMRFRNILAEECVRHGLLKDISGFAPENTASKIALSAMSRAYELDRGVDEGANEEYLHELLAKVYENGGYVSSAAIVRDKAHWQASWIVHSIAVLREAVAPTPPQSSRDAVIEECAVAVRQIDRIGREWVRDSLWDTMMVRAAATIRALKSIPSPTAPTITEEE